MTTLVKKYPVFEDNQILTSSQLNSLVEYLDQQNRLTRVSLIGVGILCGIDLSCQTVDDTVQLTISGGVGVTSEGYLIKMKECVNTKLRPYELPEGVLYPPFINPGTDEQDVTLYELLTDTADISDQDDIKAIVKDDLDNDNDIDDMVVMLFVECLDKDLKSCLGKSCDQLGIDRFLTIRKLLVSRADYEIIKSRTEGGYQDVQFSGRFDLPKLVMPRTLFLAENDHSKYYLNYSLNFLPNILSALGILVTALKESYEVYEPILEPSYGANPFDSAELNNIYQSWGTYLSGADGTVPPFLSMQYFSDFIKDMVQAYCEFRETACLLTSLCCPDTDRFPKHLTLGVVSAEAKGNVSTEFRHQFTQPPVYGNQKELSVKVIQLHQKLVAMIENFELVRLTTPIQVAGQIEAVTKITPSCEKKSLMSERSIPFYYNISKVSSFEKLGPFEILWRASEKSKFGREVLSYDKNQPQSAAKSPSSTPLDFDLDPYNFLRIEGFIGKDVNKVMLELEAYKEAKNLAFDVKPVYLGENGRAAGLPDCLCADLQTDYSIWRNKCLFMLKNILSLTSRLGNLYSKRKTVSRAVFTEFEADKSTFRSTDTQGSFEKLVKAAPGVIGLNPVGPIKVNQAKLTNISDIQIDVTRENWHLAGKQVLTSLDQFKVAEKAPIEGRSFATLPEQKTARDFFDFFNNCLCRLIDSMKVDLKDFDFELWKKEYACTFQTHIEIMKQLAGRGEGPIAHLQIYVILMIYCAVYRALCLMGIYPYISIGVIAQTLEFRKEHFFNSLKFSEFIKNHPGVEHKAGVAPGDTLLLLYLAEEEKVDREEKPKDPLVNKQLIKGLASLGIKDMGLAAAGFSSEDLSGLIEKMQNRIVGDFTLPYTCCDDCGDMPNTALALNPLALPVCGVVMLNFKDENETQRPFFSGYRPLKTKLISHVYERESFEARFVSDPEFGVATLEKVNSTFEFDIVDGKKGQPKKIEEMTYVVDQDMVAEAFRIDPTVGILVDEFEYELYRSDDPDKVICKSTISIFIPVISRTVDQEPQTVTVTGNVVTRGEKGELRGVPNATVSVKDSSSVKPAQTTSTGQFTLVDVPASAEEQQTLVVTADGYIQKNEEVKILPTTKDIGGIEIVKFIIIDQPGPFIDLKKTFDRIGIEPETPAAINLINYYVNNTNQYQSNLRTMAKTNTGTIKPVLEESAVLVKDFSEAEEINIKTFNSNFIAATKNIDATMKKANENERLVLQETMNNLTLSFLSRLSVEQPKKLTATTNTSLSRIKKLAVPKKYPELKSAVETWMEKSEGNVSPEFLTNMKASFKAR